jgi:predicted nucleic acid-binding protein
VILYYDTSALVKLMIAEQGSELARKLWSSSYAAASSILAYAEGRAALAAALRTGRLRRQDFEHSLETFEGMYEALLSIEIDEDLVRAAGRHATDLGLRGYDAVHLATALDLGDEEVVFVTWDEDLRRAASSVGLGTAGSSGY